MEEYKFLLLFTIGFALLSCQSKFDLKSDKHLTEIFSNNELFEIQKMISYVDDRAVELVGTEDINEAYHQLLNQIDDTLQNTSKFYVPFEEEEKYEFLKSLDPTVFSEFWTMSNHVQKAIYQDSIYENLDNYITLDLTRNGRYVDYLAKAGDENGFYTSVRETLELAGGITPSIVALFLKRHKAFNFTIPKNRLWVAIFILRIEEHHDKKMERYLNQKEFN